MIARACDVPRDGLLAPYARDAETYTDCFEAMSVHEVDLAAFIRAFYTTGLFRMERAVLSVFLRRWISDAQVADLAQGAASFAVWTVEGRGAREIVLSDARGLTRSYLAVSPKAGGVTRLVFGSAVVGPQGRGMRALMPLHRLYSKLLLRTAVWRIARLA